MKSEVYDLIQSLTPSEKRKFKIFADQYCSDNKNYMILFDYLSNIKSYDEIKVKEYCTRKGICKNLSNEKNRLHHTILKSLYQLNSLKDDSFQIFEKINDFRILLNKGLYRQIKRRMLKLKEQLRREKEYEKLLVVIQFEKEIAYNPLYFNEPLDRRSLLQKENEVYKILLLENEIRLNGQKAFQIINSSSKSDIDELKKILNSLPGKVPEDISFKSRVNLYFTFAIIHQELKEFNLALQWFKKIIEGFEQDVKRLNRHKTKYSIAIFNYISCCHQSKQYAEIEEYLEKYKRHLKRGASINGLEILKIREIELVYLWNNCKFEQARKLFYDAVQDYRKYGNEVSHQIKISLGFNIGVLALIFNESHIATNHFILLANEKAHSKVLKEILHIATVFLAIIMINIDKDEYCRWYLNRKLKEFNGNYENEIIIELYGVLFRYIDKKELNKRQTFREMLRMLNHCFNEGPYPDGVEELRIYLTSLVGNKPMSDIYYLRYKH